MFVFYGLWLGMLCMEKNMMMACGWMHQKFLTGPVENVG